jgi:hypothetical protein
VPVDEVGDELDVVHPVCIAAVEGRVAGDEPADPHRLGFLRREVGVARLGRELGRAEVALGHECRAEHLLRAARHVERVAVPIRDDADPALRDREVRVHRRPVDRTRERAEPPVGAGAADAEIAATVGRKLEQGRHASGRHAPPGLPEPHANRRGQRGANLRHRHGQVVGRDPRRHRADRQLHRLPREARQGANDRRRRGWAVERAA